MVTVDFDASWLGEPKRDRPLNFAHFPTGGQFPFHLGREAGVAREFPISVPVRNHPEQEAYGKWLSRNDRIDVSEEAGLNKLAALVGLGSAGAEQSQE